MQRVKSEAIEAIGYDDPSKTIHVHFRSGHKYAYAGHDQDAFDAFARADSPGGHFHRFIRSAKFERSN